ncbi:MAG: glycosyltransferase [Chitinophagaceae bacterium]|nr:glycosyltransferase [Chitinophagaceae bacterium]
MPRKKILWLCSWYPNKLDHFNGDFIQRHAAAAALYNDIYVIHVAGDASGKITGIEKIITHSEGLTEHIVYYKKSSSFPGRLMSHYRWLMLSRQAIRQYVAEHGKPDLVHIHIPVKAGITGLWMKRKYKIPYVLTEHWGIYNDVESANYKRKSVVFKRYTKKILKEASLFLSVSRYLAEGVNRLVTKKEFEIVPNVVNTELFNYKNKVLTSFCFIHVSNMVPLKNAKGILKAFNLLLLQKSNATLVMVGDTDMAIRNFARELGLTETHISFRGEIAYSQVALEMQQSDCLIVFSNIENSPCVIGEALCCGLPVIATDVGGIPELVNENNSIRVVPKDEEALAGVMRQMMDNYAKFDRKKIAEDAQSRFSYPVIGKKIDEIYSRFATGKI